MIDASLEQAIRARFDGSTFATWMGLELVSLDDGGSELRLSLQPHHLNPGGIAHGGVIASMLDSAIGLAQRTKLGMDSSHVTVQLHVNYLHAVRSGVITARGRAVHAGGRAGYGEATLTDADGRVLARAGATFLVVSGDSLNGE